MNSYITPRFLAEHTKDMIAGTDLHVLMCVANPSTDECCAAAFNGNEDMDTDTLLSMYSVVTASIYDQLLREGNSRETTVKALIKHAAFALSDEAQNAIKKDGQNVTD